MASSTSERVYGLLLGRLAISQWANRDRLPPARQLAGEFGVSLATMQRTLRRAARDGLLVIRERHRSRLAPNAADGARRRLAEMAACRRARLAILIPQQHVAHWINPVYAEMIEHITHEAERRDFRVEVLPWPARNQAHEVERLLCGGHNAACAIGFRPEQMISLYLLHERGLPVLALNRFSTELHIPSVRFDDEDPSYTIAEELIRLGHRNLCMVTHSDRGAGADGRVAGWFNCLEDYGLTQQCSMPFYINATECHKQFYNRSFVELLAGPRSPTAIVFAHATLAARFSRDDRLTTKRVPEELSLAYFGTDPRVERASWCPPLTTIVPDMHRVAECVLETIGKLMAGDRMPPNIRVPMEIHYTESIGPGPFAGELLAKREAGSEDRRAG